MFLATDRLAIATSTCPLGIFRQFWAASYGTADCSCPHDVQMERPGVFPEIRSPKNVRRHEKKDWPAAMLQRPLSHLRIWGSLGATNIGFRDKEKGPAR